MFIANIIFFKGAWLHPFPRNKTYLGTFYHSNSYNNVGDIKQLRVPFMRTKNVFYHGWSKELDCQILRLPYKDGLYSMFVLLPNTLGGLSQLIRSLTLSSVSQLRYTLEKKVVDVSLPKFKVKFKTGLAQILKDYGLKEMFGNTANFSGISGDHISGTQLLVSDIVQTSGIEVDEEGTVAYTVTDVSIGNKFGESVERFNATHPFMFFIEGPSGTVLFIGKLDDPMPEVLPLSTHQAYFDAAEAEVSPNRISPFPLRSNVLSKHNFSVLPTEVPILQPNPFQVADTNDVSYRFSYFDLEILNELGDSTKNVLISPASIKSIFAILLEGAKGRTATEISEALRINNNQEGFHEILYHLLNGLNMKTPGVTVQNRNGIFTSNKVKLVDSFRANSEKFYKTVFKTIDFTNTNIAAGTINGWVSNATNGVINDFVAPDTLRPDTKMLVTNALYFKGKWKTAFDPKNTYQKCFRTDNGCVTTSFMSVTEYYNYNYVVSIHAHVVEIPYEDNFSMLLILPSEERSVRAVIRDLHHTNLLDIINYLKSTELILEIPKFSFEYSTDLVPHLRGLKIREIFGQQANLSGIVQDGGVFVDNVIHKTKIEVDEKGTVAAAATGAVIVPLIGTWSFVVDRPFIFFIYQKPTPNSINIAFEGILQHP
ncbi:unnamed protein product [Acanthoscelides obtectus]|nr:unnamed protein product [Acanthoscelides obtectus]CAK1628165.1 Serine protease inhibitor 42Dd [Acanthoscelides obtectus]